MQKIIIFMIIIILSSCKTDNDYVNFKGTVTNPNSDSLLISSSKYKKTIPSVDIYLKD